MTTLKTFDVLESSAVSWRWFHPVCLQLTTKADRSKVRLTVMAKKSAPGDFCQNVAPNTSVWVLVC